MQEIKAIDTIPTEELLSELCKRCSPAIFIGTKNEGGVEKEVNFYEARGNLKSCYGLCHEMAVNIQTMLIKEAIRDKE